MKLYDEEEFEIQKENRKKTKKFIIILIIILTILILLMLSLILYKKYNPDKITTRVYGAQIINNLDISLDIHENENGETEIYLPIKEIANYLGYKAYNGEYNKASEEKNKCYVIKEDCEVAMYSLKSKTIYKKDLQNNTKSYEYINIEKAVFENNGILYTSKEGIEKGFNVAIEYDSKKKTLDIYTIDYMIQKCKEKLVKNEIVDYEIDEDNYQNYKAVFDNMLIIKAEDGKYGVVNATDLSTILEAKYDGIKYIQHTTDFKIETNQKYGIITKNGKTKVSPNYEELSLIDENNNLYIIKKNNLFGVIDDNEKIIIYPENDEIGINIEEFSYNNIKNGYIILNKLIPVKREGKWAFYNINGKMITDGFIYDKIGCNVNKGNNIHSLLEIPDYNVIIVGSNENYTFMDETGNDQILPFVFNSIYMKISSGEISYWMEYNEKQYDVFKYLEKKGIKNNGKKE